MKYIDTELLRKEINERLSCNGAFDEVGDSAWHYDQGIIAAYKHILSFIDSLQQEQPKVDLEKEIDIYLEPIQAWQVQETPFTSLENCARHFYELGLRRAAEMYDEIEYNRQRKEE